ncbi:hypothetical protein HDV03_000743 [Kappamyces sp. JEL0829]|nr:hypothetical protein HDV03_000743 [Kappamyces sp. JEL0829]
MTVEQVPEGFVALDDTLNVYKKTTHEGQGDVCSRTGATVQVHYEGRLVDGTVFDSSYERGDPISFPLGKGNVIKGWDVGIATMKVGEKGELWIKSDYGYGASGSPPKIPGGATLIFKVELVSVDLSTAEMTEEEKIASALKSKEEGNEFFKAGNFQSALHAYNAALAIIKNTASQKNVTVSLYSNVAQCHLKLKNGKEALAAAQSVLDLEPTHAKAIYRAFLARVALSEFEAAAEFLEDNKALLPDVDVAAELARVQKLKAHQAHKEKQMYAKMFA